MTTKDRRLYAKFDIGMDEHAKIIVLSDAAFRALFESTLYSRRQLTDGFLDERVVIRKWGADVANELSSNDPERPSWVKVEGGWTIHDFSEHQTTTLDIQAKREAGRKGGLAKAEQKASTPVAPASDMLKHLPSNSLAKTETETETETETFKPPSSPAAPSTVGFDEFWKLYPRKKGKEGARAAYVKALKKTSRESILNGVKAHLPEWATKEPDKVPHPTTWLNQGRWDDEVETVAKRAFNPNDWMNQ